MQQNFNAESQKQHVACPKCGGININFQMISTAQKHSHAGAGCLWAIGRWTLILCTCGLWLFVSKHKGKTSTKIKSKTMAVCQSCGYSWSA